MVLFSSFVFDLTCLLLFPLTGILFPFRFYPPLDRVWQNLGTAFLGLLSSRFQVHLGCDPLPALAFPTFPLPLFAAWDPEPCWSSYGPLARLFVRLRVCLSFFSGLHLTVTWETLSPRGRLLPPSTCLLTEALLVSFTLNRVRPCIKRPSQTGRFFLFQKPSPVVLA